VKTENYTEFDIVCMERALQLAQRASGLNHPNPLVGAVVAKDGKIIGEEYHLYETVVHAEPAAILNAGEESKGATLYTNLEPCSHHGRTPPCVDEIIRSGINRVVFSICDPDERVCNRGKQILLDAGIQVDVGLLEKKAEEINRDYLKAKRTGLPWAIVKIASSLDGRIGIPNTKGVYLSSRESLEVVHLMRAWCDAIMVGASTVRLDNPRLTCRIDDLDKTLQVISDGILYPKPVKQRNPARVTISESLDLPVGSKIFDTSHAKTIVVVSVNTPFERTHKLEEKGVEIVRAERDSSGIILTDAFSKLCSKGIMNIVVEGGGKLIWGLIEKKLVDEIYLTIAPILIGGKDSPTWLDGRVADSLGNAPALTNTAVFKVGPDLLIRSRLAD
jgi:diaminohydroxyphosphoribosylaminopyrimidine deaminase/5-amino-6-(5-phosphoribosylamino)uracil reductase